MPRNAAPSRTLGDRRVVEAATAEWVHWFNIERLHSMLDYQTPAEVEDAHYAPTEDGNDAVTRGEFMVPTGDRVDAANLLRATFFKNG